MSRSANTYIVFGIELNNSIKGEFNDLPAYCYSMFDVLRLSRYPTGYGNTLIGFCIEYTESCISMHDVSLKLRNHDLNALRTAIHECLINHGMDPCHFDDISINPNECYKNLFILHDNPE